jgi:hypothetical protein
VLLLLLPLHAFLGGKAACGLTMAAIRCASKAALPGKSMQHLQLGTAVFLAVGALLVAMCVFIVGVLLPRLQAGMEAESLPPSKLSSVQCTQLSLLLHGRTSKLLHVTPR